MDRSNLIFLDTETTGIGPDGRLCQLGYIFRGEEYEGLFKPPVPIEIDAMAVSHITNRMVADKEAFIGSKAHKKLQEILADGNILVAHNAQFDVEILKREGIVPQKIIDTFKVAQHLDEEAVIPRYGLQYLRYYFDLEVPDATAHTALGDVRVLVKIFEHLFARMLESSQDEQKVLTEMIEISARPILIKRFIFGKYVGERVMDVAERDPGYLKWLLAEKVKAREQGGPDDEDWVYTIEHYLELFCR